MDYGNSKYGQKAEENFLNGYNCTQAVFLAFSDLHGMDGKTAARLSSSFGGGMGRLREVCGAASGMFLVAGMLYGYEKPGDAQGKKEHYARIQQLAKAYEKMDPSSAGSYSGLPGSGMSLCHRAGLKNTTKSAPARN